MEHYKHNWIEIGTSGIGHLSPTDCEAVQGFYTTDVEDCINIVISGSGVKKGELFLIHLDSRSRNDKLLEILNKIKDDRDNYNVELIFNQDFYGHNPDISKFIERFGADTIEILGTFLDKITPLSPIHSERDIGFTVRRDGEIHQINKAFALGPLYSKELQMDCRNLINYMNRVFSDKKLGLDTQFEHEERTQMPEPTTFVKELISVKTDAKRRNLLLRTGNIALLQFMNSTIQQIKNLEKMLSSVKTGSNEIQITR